MSHVNDFFCSGRIRKRVVAAAKYKFQQLANEAQKCME
jgi:hypothetical protein